MYATSFEGRPLNGCLFEQTPSAAPQLGAADVAPGNLPQRVDLRPLCTPVEDQGQTNSCVANATVGALELLMNKAGRGGTDLSRLFVYFNSRAIEHREHLDEGTYINHAMAAVLAFGICEERMWPFQKATVNSKPTDGCYQNATHYEAVQYARTPGKSALASLAQELPVVFGINLPNECYDAARETGNVPNPDELPATSPAGGHAMLIVGYDMAESHYIVRNSWGPGYGKEGYIFIPFNVMDKYAHPDQFYTIGAIEQAPGLKIFGEAVADNVNRLIANVNAITPPNLTEKRDGLRGELESRLSNAKRDFASRLRGGN